jgi:hypothetical protein
MKLTKIIAAAAAPLALGGVMLATASHASAVTPAVLTAASVQGHTTGSVTCTAGNQESLNAMGTVNGNLDVPAGATCQLRWVHVTGSVSVEGALSATAVVFDRNVSVSGPGSQLWLFNQASHIKGNLSVTSSSGAWNGSAGTSFGDNTDQPATLWPDAATANGVSQVDGNFSFTGNTGWLYVGSPLHVGGNFTASGNGPYANPAVQFDYSGLAVQGHSSIS